MIEYYRLLESAFDDYLELQRQKWIARHEECDRKYGTKYGFRKGGMECFDAAEDEYNRAIYGANYDRIKAAQYADVNNPIHDKIDARYKNCKTDACRSKLNDLVWDGYEYRSSKEAPIHPNGTEINYDQFMSDAAKKRNAESIRDLEKRSKAETRAEYERNYQSIKEPLT